MNTQHPQRGLVRKGLSCLVLGGALLASTPSAQALEISFDGTGYSAVGSVGTVLGVDGKAAHGQGDGTTKWNDAGTNFAVVQNAGNGGDNSGLVTATNQLANQSLTFTPTLAQLGAAAFSTNTTQHISLAVRLIDDGNKSTATEIYRLGLGLVASPTYPVELQIMGGGKVNIRNSGVSKFSILNALAEGGAYRTFSIAVNYATRTVDVSLDGEPQGSYTFADSFAAYGQFKFNVRQTSPTIGIAIDSVSAVVTPNPVIPVRTLLLVR